MALNMCEGLLVGDLPFDCDGDSAPDLMELLLINWEDVKTKSVTDGKATISLKTSKKASVIGISRKSAGGTEAVKQNDYAPTASTHTVKFMVQKRDASTSVQLENIRRGKFIAVSKAKQLGVYEVWGFRAGLECNGGDRDTSAQSGMINMSIATPEESAGDTLYYMDEAAYEALKVAGV